MPRQRVLQRGFASHEWVQQELNLSDAQYTRMIEVRDAPTIITHDLLMFATRLKAKSIKKVMRWIGQPATRYNYMRKEEMLSLMAKWCDPVSPGGRRRFSARSIVNLVLDIDPHMTVPATVAMESALENLAGYLDSIEPGGHDATPEPKGDIVQETPVPDAGAKKPDSGLEGALFSVIESAISGRLEELLNERGLTAESVEDIIQRKLETIEVPKVIKNLDGDTPDMVHPSFEEMLKVLSCGLYPYLMGPAGSGKTHAAQQFADMVERPCTVIPCNEEMTVTDLIGYRDMRGEYVKTAFYTAFLSGHVIVMDEADKAPGPVLVSLNSAIQQNRMLFPTGQELAHEDVVFIFTGNTRMTGASAAYSTGQKQDESLKNRLINVEWGYDTRLEKALTISACKAHDGDESQALEWLRYVRLVRQQLEKMSLSYVAGPRQAVAGARLLASGMDLEKVKDQTIFLWMREEDARRAKEACK